MHEWVVIPWAAPVQAYLLGCLSIVIYMVPPRCWEDFMGALGVGSPTGCPQGPNFRDDTLRGAKAEASRQAQ